jgi:outer membrane lipoprotein-sorting protein
MNSQSTDRLNREMPDDIVDQAIVSLQGEAIPAGPPPQLITATLHALHESEPPHRNTLRFIPRTKIMKFYTTAAAVFLVASVATLLGLALNSPSSAFGQALKQVREARSMSFSQLQSDGKQLAINTKVYLAEDGRRRSEMRGKENSGGVTTIFDSTGSIRIVLLELTKTAIVEDAKENRSINAGKLFLNWLEDLKKLGDKPDQELGKKELDGKAVTGFVATQGNFKYTMWIDGVTRELVRMEYDSPVNGAAYHITMTDFRFNEDLDNSLFSFDVPSGYKAQKQPPVPVVAGGESSIIEALRGYTKRDGGKFPASISEWGPWAVLFSKDSHDGKLDAEATRVLANLGAITPFLVSMPRENYAYLGEGKMVDQKDTIVFWYKKADGTYRAIYADLTTQDISADKVPKK